MLRTFVEGAHHPRQQVQRAIEVLESHHSRSELPRQARQLLLSWSSMAWWCVHCRRHVKASASFCSSCGHGWEENTTYSTRTVTPPWSSSQWRENSPRLRQNTASPRRRRDKGRGRGQGQLPVQAPAANQGGKGNKGDKGGKFGQPGRLADIPAAPTASIPPPPPTASTSSEPADKASQALSELVSALEGQEGLTPEIQSLLAVHSQAAHRSNAKSLHRLVSQQSTAQVELTKVHKAKADFMSEWAAYLSSLSDLLARQIKEKTEAMQNFQATESRWREQLQAATTALAQASARPDDATVINLDAEAMVEEEAEADARRTAAADRTAAVEAELISTLQGAKRSAEEEIAAHRERTPRRARKDDGKDSEAAKNKQPPQ